MKPIKFSKFHGFGNDYIVIQHEEIQSIHDLGEFSKRICHRNLGVGGDGIAVLRKLDEEADYECRIINPDGSEAGFSGNGTRCAVAFLYYENLFTELNLKLKTNSGVKNYQFLKREDNTFWFLAELGNPSEITNYELRITNYEKPFSVVTLDVGNPVCVYFVEDFGAIDWREIGKETESHPHFPNRTNVVFVKPIDKNNIEIRIWERGAGETSSSGTCSIAAAVASNFADKTGRNVSVHAEGGTTEAVWREDDEMMITGRADLAFTGEYFFEF
ncbi:MAG TPA: diaminopimelate epimerase [Pyrinomonadaceae bacterium]|nr:diaminopimelate epimerase [Pyrinomonadaceae bacterium]